MPDIWYGTSGPRDARIMIVGEAWGHTEKAAQQPFVGSSGQELTRMLTEAGIDRNACLLTNVYAGQPPRNEMWQMFDLAKTHTGPTIRGLHPKFEVYTGLRNLHNLIDTVRPEIIFAAGNYPLWALTDHAGVANGKDALGKSTGIKVPTGIMNWRGSQTYLSSAFSDIPVPRIPVLPVIHPAAILRQWELRAVTVHDMKVRPPKAFAGEWDGPRRVTIAPPTYAQVIEYLEGVLSELDKREVILACDIETKVPLLVCIGFAMTTNFAISIPFLQIGKDLSLHPYWHFRQEARILHYLQRIFLHPNCRIVGQNFIYDTQYIETEMGVTPPLFFDTMLAQHLLFPGTPKGLDYLSSLYCDHHIYWKEDGKDWHVKEDLASQLRYNGVDCMRTLECFFELDNLLDEMGMRHLWQEELEKNTLALDMMRKGVRIDLEARAKMRFELMQQQSAIQAELLRIMPQSFVSEIGGDAFWFKSAPKTKFVLYELLGLKKIKSRKTGEDSTGKEALAELAELYPRLKRLFDLIGALRSVGVFQSNFILKQLEPLTNRMVCSFNPAGTETFRWSSSENAYGRGTNLQNIPSGNEE